MTELCALARVTEENAEKRTKTGYLDEKIDGDAAADGASDDGAGGGARDPEMGWGGSIH